MTWVYDRGVTAGWGQVRSLILRVLAYWLGGLFLVTLITGCALTGSRAIEVGAWYDSAGELVPESAVLDRVQRRDMVLLGEVHDSAAVHRKQLAMLAALDRPIVLALEQLDLGVQGSPESMNDGLDEIGAKERATRGGFDFEGWGWDQYGGLFERATSQRWPLWPLNMSRRQAIAIAMASGDGWREHLQPRELKAIERLGPDLVLPEPHQADLITDLQEAHCGRMGGDAAHRMARAQIARDMLMADALIRANSNYPEHLVVGVMGNQHARLDRGVGYWLKQLGSNRQDIVAIGMLPIDSIETLAKAAQAYDFVWVTEPVDREDHCE